MTLVLTLSWSRRLLFSSAHMSLTPAIGSVPPRSSLHACPITTGVNRYCKASSRTIGTGRSAAVGSTSSGMSMAFSSGARVDASTSGAGSADT